MALPWSEKELEDKLEALDCEGVMKVVASLLFSHPDVLQRLPGLTEQLSDAAKKSTPAREVDVFKWIDASFSSRNVGPRRIQPNRPPVSPRADVELKAEMGKDESTPFSPTGTARSTAVYDQWAAQIAEAAVSKSECASLRAGRRLTGKAGKAIAGMPAGASHAVPEDVPDCLLQFSTAVYFAKEGEDQEVSLDVMRLGSDKERVCCHFATQDGDGKAGSRYEAVSGELTFEPGEVMKRVCVPIIDSRAWSSSLEFKVVLSNPSCACSLGRYLYLCRIKVIDPDCFPTNKYADAIHAHDWLSISMFGLLFEYFKFNYHSNPIVFKKTKHQFVVDQVSNVYFVFRLYIGKVLLDKVLRAYNPAQPERGCAPGGYVFLGAILPCPGSKDPTDSSQYDFKMQLLLICGVVIVVPQFLIHFLEYKRVFFKIGGTSRKTLQGNLVRKFLNYEDSARAQLGASDLVMAMTRDTQMLVHDGYMQIFPLVQNLGKLVMMAILQLCFKAYFAMIPVVLFPIILLSVLVMRNPISTHSSHEQDVAQNDLTNYVTEITSTYMLICDFVKRPQAVSSVEEKIGTFNKKMMAADSINFNNKYVCKWLSLLCVAAWLIFGGYLVLSGTSELGTFVTNLAVFNEVGQSWTVIYEVMLNMQNALPYLQKITRYMNLPIDLEKRMRLNRKRRAAGEEARMAMKKSLSLGNQQDDSEAQGSHVVFAADLVPIAVKELAYAYHSPLLMHQKLQLAHTVHPVQRRNFQGIEAAVEGVDEKSKDGSIKNCSLSFPQGSFITLVGIPGHGKSTLMRLLGGQIVPDSGDLLIPPHLRCLHISPQPSFFRDTLLMNLTYGVSKENAEDGSVERVTAVLRRLKVSENLFQYLDPSNPEMFEVKAVWGDLLSATQFGLLSLARAFIANPEVLVLHKPTVFFNDELANNIYVCINDFIVQRGLCMDVTKVAYRRPRTCIITATRPQGVEAADEVFRVTPTCTLALRSDVAVTTEMLR